MSLSTYMSPYTTDFSNLVGSWEPGDGTSCSYYRFQLPGKYVDGKTVCGVAVVGGAAHTCQGCLIPTPISGSDAILEAFGYTCIYGSPGCIYTVWVNDVDKPGTIHEYTSGSYYCLKLPTYGTGGGCNEPYYAYVALYIDK